MASGSVKRVWFSKVRMPRSQSMTFGLPSLRMYSAARRNSSMVALGPRLRSTGFLRFADGFEQAVVLHVAGADLQDVGVFGDERRHLRCAMTSVTIGEAGLFAGGGEQFQAFFLQALEAVGAGAGLEGAAAEGGGAGGFDRAGRVEDLLFALDRAGAGDDADHAGADLRLPTVTWVGSFFTSRLATL